MNDIEAKELFDQITNDLIEKNPNVRLGKMMSAPGIQYKKKNFAFIHDGEMTFKLGKNFNAQANGIHEVRYLSPFKTKPPLKAWYVISQSQMQIWPDLAEMALDYIIQEQG